MGPHIKSATDEHAAASKLASKKNGRVQADTGPRTGADRFSEMLSLRATGAAPAPSKPEGGTSSTARSIAEAGATEREHRRWSESLRRITADEPGTWIGAPGQPAAAWASGVQISAEAAEEPTAAATDGRRDDGLARPGPDSGGSEPVGRVEGIEARIVGPHLAKANFDWSAAGGPSSAGMELTVPRADGGATDPIWGNGTGMHQSDSPGSAHAHGPDVGDARSLHEPSAVGMRGGMALGTSAPELITGEGAATIADAKQGALESRGREGEATGTVWPLVERGTDAMLRGAGATHLGSAAAPGMLEGHASSLDPVVRGVGTFEERQGFGARAVARRPETPIAGGTAPGEDSRDTPIAVLRGAARAPAEVASGTHRDVPSAAATTTSDSTNAGTAGTFPGGRLPAADRGSMQASATLERHMPPVAVSEQARAARGGAMDGADAATTAAAAGRSDGEGAESAQQVRNPDATAESELARLVPEVRAAPARQIAAAIAQELGRPQSAQAEPGSAFGLPPAGGREPVRILKVALEPADLGRVTIQLRTNGRSVHLSMTAERAETSALLNSDRHTLGRILESSGFEVERVTIQVSTPDRAVTGVQPDTAMQSSQSMPQTAFSPGSGSERQHANRSSGRSDASRQEEKGDEDRDTRRGRGDLYV